MKLRKNIFWSGIILSIGSIVVPFLIILISDNLYEDGGMVIFGLVYPTLSAMALGILLLLIGLFMPRRK